MNRSTLDVAPFVVAGLATAMGVALAATAGTAGWDDAAITVAYARTAAETGILAVTPVSDPAEGFSSPLFFWALRPIQAGFPDVAGAMLRAQLLSSVGAGLLLFLVALLARSLALPPAFGAVAVALVALLSPTLREVRNGMENTWTAAWLTGLILVSGRDRTPWSTALVAALAALTCCTRFEGFGFVAFVVAALVWNGRRWAAVAATAGAAAGVLTVQTWRFVTFGTLIPNTLMAKMGPPYHREGLYWVVRTRVVAGLEPAEVLVIPLLVLGVVALWRLRGWPTRAELAPWIPVLALALAGLVVGPLVGRNWGHIGRMALPALPAMVLLLAAGLERASRGLTDRKVGLLLGATALGQVAWVAPVPWEHQNLSVASYAETGEWLEDLRRELGLAQLTVVIPDVGGTALAGRALRIVDLGKLAHAELATDGYAALPAVLERERPELIVVHGMWAAASGIYDWPGLSAYELLIPPEPFADGRVFLIRRDRVRGPLGPIPARSWPPAERAFVATRERAWLR